VRELAEARPLAVLIDDLHWADLASLELLAHLARHTPTDRLLLLGTYRDAEAGVAHPVRRLAHSLHREGRTRAVMVERLDQTMTARLITQQLEDQAPVSAELVDLVHRHCAGNPFFIVELVTAWADRGDLELQSGEWVCRQEALLEAPASVSEAIGERYFRLSPAAREVLDVASVLGEVMDAEDLTTDEPALDEAVSAGLLTAVEDRYAFDHTLTRQSLYSRLSPARRRRLHREIGELLGRRPPAVRRRRAAEIARHLEAGGDLAGAVPFCLLAGDVSAELHSPHEAMQLFQRAFELADETGDEVAVAAALERLGRVEVVVARYDDAVDHLDRASVILRRRAEVEAWLRVEGLIGQALHRRGVSQAAADRLADVVAELDLPIGTGGAAPGVAALCMGLARVRLSLGQLGPAQEALGHAARLARAEGAVAVEADSYAVAGTIRLFIDEPDQAVDDLERGIRLARSVDAVAVESEASLALQWALTMRGQFDRALELGYRGMELTRRSGDTDAQALHAADTGLTYFYLGDWASAQRHLELGVELARGSSLTLFSGIAPAYLGLLRSAQGDLAGARASYEEALTAPDLKTFAFDAWLDAREAELDLAEGEPHVALARLEPWLSQEAPTRLHDVMLFKVAAEVCLALEDPERAEELVGRALRRAAATRNEVDGATARLLEQRIRGLTHRLPTDSDGKD
jgi:tetratricopeptide (TPR) repeat protein